MKSPLSDIKRIVGVYADTTYIEHVETDEIEVVIYPQYKQIE
ncbi:hypothetical protein [Paenibacillus agilis]|nr:hypothetical protein [Paenibacillus agilis]